VPLPAEVTLPFPVAVVEVIAVVAVVVTAAGTEPDEAVNDKSPP